MGQLCNHSVGESRSISVISALSFSTYARAPNTPDASLCFNERRECEEKSDWGGASGQDTDTSASWQLIDGQCSSHIRDLKVQLETEVSPPQASP